ncbi:MAG: glutamate synthase [Clostridia bacterium]|nr:glutamate synthase [Clostridia bacterium]
MKIDASGKTQEELNEYIRRNEAPAYEIDGCLGQRFIAAGAENRRFLLHGTPGNALAAYCNGAYVEVDGNAQDAVGDTMNDGKIVIHGSVGDAVGYAMRGGSIFVQGNAGYRAGIHMKEYKEKVPLLVIGGTAGSFLGEYQAGGVIIVLGLNGKTPIVGNFPCTGMHGGKVLLRSSCKDVSFPKNVVLSSLSVRGSAFEPILKEFCSLFGQDEKDILDAEYTLVTPDDKNPYKQMYVQN